MIFRSTDDAANGVSKTKIAAAAFMLWGVGQVAYGLVQFFQYGEIDSATVQDGGQRFAEGLAVFGFRSKLDRR